MLKKLKLKAAGVNDEGCVSSFDRPLWERSPGHSSQWPQFDLQASMGLSHIAQFENYSLTETL